MKIHLITEIPGPYRNPHFAELNRQLRNLGHELTVHFMAESDDIRPDSWFDKSGIVYPHFFHKTTTIRVGRRKIYWNFSIVRDMIRLKPDIIITGGLWSSLTCLLITIMWPKDRLVAWVELNENVLGVSNFLTNAIRKWLLRQPSALAVPGRSAENYLEQLFNRSPDSMNLIPFPNLIDQELFNPEASIQIEIPNEVSLSPEKRLALWPARLEVEKGIEDFLPLLSPAVLENWQIFILGQGSRLEPITELIQEHKLEPFIAIHPYVTPEQMMGFYQKAQVLLLPSLRDPNPLSVIEALRMGLPMMLSDAVGNHYEALSRNNGWLLPLKAAPAKKQSLINELFSKSPGELKRMGEKSKEVYAERWELEKVCSITANHLHSLAKK